MTKLHSNLYYIGNALIALVWLINGLWCKVLNQVPRHQYIVMSIIEHAPRLLTILIGICEIILGIWVLSKKFTKPTAWFQVIIIMTMNIVEFIWAREWLLWGKWNIVFALLFSAFILFNEYVLKRKAHV